MPKRPNGQLGLERWNERKRPRPSYGHICNNPACCRNFNSCRPNDIVCPKPRCLIWHWRQKKKAAALKACTRQESPPDPREKVLLFEDVWPSAVEMRIGDIDQKMGRTINLIRANATRGLENQLNLLIRRREELENSRHRF